MKAVIAINTVTQVIEVVQPVTEDINHTQHLALRLSNQPGFHLLFLDIKNNTFPDENKNNVIIYDSLYSDHGFHPAIVLVNTTEAMVKDYYDIVSPLIINELVKNIPPDRVKTVLNAIGIVELRTNSKERVNAFIASIQRQIAESYQESSNPPIIHKK